MAQILEFPSQCQSFPSIAGAAGSRNRIETDLKQESIRGGNILKNDYCKAFVLLEYFKSFHNCLILLETALLEKRCNPRSVSGFVKTYISLIICKHDSPLVEQKVHTCLAYH